MTDQKATPPQTKALKPIDALRGDVAKMEGQFKMALPQHISTEKFVRVVQTAINNTPSLASANRASFFSAAMKAAQDGLLPDGKEAALIPFGSGEKASVQYIPMIAGILKKVRNSGELAMITAQMVFEADKFKYWIDTDGEHIEHVPFLFGDRGKPKGVYALAKTKDGAVYIEFLTVADVMAIKNVSRSKGSGPWAGDFEFEMWRKSAIRRLSKRLPMSTDLEQTIHADDEVFLPEPPEQPGEQTEPATKPKTSSRLKDAIKKSEPKDVTPTNPETPPPPQDETPMPEIEQDVSDEVPI